MLKVRGARGDLGEGNEVGHCITLARGYCLPWARWHPPGGPFGLQDLLVDGAIV